MLTFGQVAEALGVSINPQRVDSPITGWSIDSRTLQPGDLFFALRGPNFDGHAYVHAALQSGAAGAVVEHEIDGLGGLIVVPDSLAALQSLARWARRRWQGTVVAVTGSAGKTTTKDAIAHLLGSTLTVGRTAGNLNNNIGVPLSILRLPADAEVAVLELGMNHAGEIRELASIAAPHIGVVTNVGHAHVEFFDSIEGVARAKRELIESLPADGVAVLNADDPRVLAFRDVHPGRSVTFGFGEAADVRAESVESSDAGTRFRAIGVDFETSLVGRHAVMNLLAALAVALILHVSPDALRRAVTSFTVGKMRGVRIESHGVTIWDDCYNSNPDAARAMLDVLAGTPARRRIAVLGEMLELGRSTQTLHRELGRYAAGRGIDFIIGVRGAARDMVDEAVRAGVSGGAAIFFEDPVAAGDFVRRQAQSGDAVLFKGSRGVHVERALERLLA